MDKKIFILWLVFFILSVGIASAEPSQIDLQYTVRESVKIVENIIVFPFRLIRDIFDPAPLPPPVYPVMVPYAIGPTSSMPATIQSPVATSAPTPVTPKSKHCIEKKDSQGSPYTECS